MSDGPHTPRPDTRSFDFDLLDECDSQPQEQQEQQVQQVQQVEQVVAGVEGAGQSQLDIDIPVAGACAAATVEQPSEQEPEYEQPPAGPPDMLFDFDALPESESDEEREDEDEDEHEAKTHAQAQAQAQAEKLDEAEAAGEGEGEAEAQPVPLAQPLPLPLPADGHGQNRQEEPLSSLAAYHTLSQLDQQEAGAGAGAAAVAAHELQLQYSGLPAEPQPPQLSDCQESCASCWDPLALVTESSGWDHEDERLKFAVSPAEEGDRGVAHHRLYLILAPDQDETEAATGATNTTKTINTIGTMGTVGTTGATGTTGTTGTQSLGQGQLQGQEQGQGKGQRKGQGQGQGQGPLVSCTFQVVSVDEGWDSLVCPVSMPLPTSGRAWGKENLLIPGQCDAVQAQCTASVGGSSHSRSHGHYFCIIEPRGTAVVVCVNVAMRRGLLQAQVWYECCDVSHARAQAGGACRVCDPTPVPKREIGAFARLRGHGQGQGQATGPGHASTGTTGLLPNAKAKSTCRREVEREDWQDQLLQRQMEAGAQAHAHAHAHAYVQAQTNILLASEGLRECCENLVLVCDATDWDPTLEKLRFVQVSARDDGAIVQHQLSMRLATEGQGQSRTRGEPIAWESAFVSLTFQILSRDKKWDWRLFPADVPLRGEGKAWGAENLLVPGSPDAVKVAQGAEGPGLRLHGRDFHIVEEFGTALTIFVELTSRDPQRQQGRTQGEREGEGLVHARVWYELGCATTVRFVGHDRKTATKGSVLKAMRCRGKNPAGEWDRAIKSRCPAWWRSWDRLQTARKRAAHRAREVLEAEIAAKDREDTLPPTNEEAKLNALLRIPRTKSAKPFTKDEALFHLGRFLSHQTTNQRVLDESRPCSVVKFGLLESFPVMPPAAIRVLSQMVEEVVLKNAECSTFSAFLERFAFAAWDPSVLKACEKLSRCLEFGLEDGVAAKKDKEALMVLKDKSAIAACGTRLAAGTRVMLRWQPNCDGAKHLPYLNGHVGQLMSFDKASLRWTVAFETFDGHIQVASEHLHVCKETVTSTGKADSTRSTGAEPECDMCTGRFLETQLLVLGCPAGHQFCHDCLRKWVRRQLVPRCYRCLEEKDDLLMPGDCSGEPWMAVPKSDGSAGDDYRITKAEIDQLDCICAVEVSGGAQCIIVGIQGLSGKRCTVGRVEKSNRGCFAAAYLAGGRKIELAISCLEVDDCLSAGRIARGEVCPSKGERFGLGLSVASLGCACPVKQTMNELCLEQFAMPYDWLVSRVEGVLYMFRHGFRDFNHHDDIRRSDTYHGFFHEQPRQGGAVERNKDEGYQSYRNVYHSFPHHDITKTNTRGAFARRCDRLLNLVRGACLEATSRPILLVRICARSAEIAYSEELYASLRALGGQKIYLLVVVTEQPQCRGAVQHLRHPNLIFYMAGGGNDLMDALRFGMDYAYARDNFGLSDITVASRESCLSPIASAAAIRKDMNHHQVWLNRDKNGEPSLSDIAGCFDPGPNQFFPGRFHTAGKFEASPHQSRELLAAVRKGDLSEVARLGVDGADINAWDLKGETVLFEPARRGDLALCTSLLLAAADPNCRDREGKRPVDHLNVIITSDEMAQPGAQAKAQGQVQRQGQGQKQAQAQAQAQVQDGSARGRGRGRGGGQRSPAQPVESNSSSQALVPLSEAATITEATGPSAPELRRHTRCLLLHWGGLDTVTEDDLLGAVAAVSEPDRRRLVSRLGICTPPDVLPRRLPVLKLAKSTQALFTRQMLAEAEMQGEDMAAALMKLRETAGLPVPERRQMLRTLLRDWHPDKHQGKPKEEQDHANRVFCYIQGMRTLYLGPEEKEGGASAQTEA